MMIIDILTLFPKMFKGPFEESIIKRAQKKGLVKIKIHNLRDWAKDRHKTVDDRPYGGGAGMILKVDVIYKALKQLTKQAKIPFPPNKTKPKDHRIILLDPAGKKFNQKKAQKLSKLEHLILVCGHYEGVDERVKKHLVHEEISIGDYVLTGGELPAMVLVDTIIRLIPGVLEKPEALVHESFQPSTINRAAGIASLGLRSHFGEGGGDARHQPSTIESPHFTRPADFLGWKVPKVLLSGDHKKIQAWRLQKSLEKTRRLRPDLIRT